MLGSIPSSGLAADLRGLPTTLLTLLGTFVRLLEWTAIAVLNVPPGMMTSLSDVCYQFQYTPREYQFAITVCEQSRGNLLSVHDQQTNDLIADAIAGTTFNWFWVGANDYSGEWAWADQTPFDYTHWAASTSMRSCSSLPGPWLYLNIGLSIFCNHMPPNI